MRTCRQKPPIDEKVLVALLRLYAASSRRTFHGHLHRLVTGVFGETRFSLLIPDTSTGGFALEYCSCLERQLLEDSIVVSSALAGILEKGEGNSPLDPGQALLDCGSMSLPVAEVKVLRGAGAPLGVLVFHEQLSSEGYAFAGGGDLDLLPHICTALRLVREREELRRSLERSNSTLQAFQTIGALLGQLDLESLLSNLLSFFVRLTSAQVGSIVLEHNARCSAELGLIRSVLDRIRKRGGSPLSELVAESRQPLLVRDYADNPEYEPVPDFLVRSFLCVPILSKDKVLGTVNLVNSEAERDGGFTEADRDLLMAISSLGATAVENGMLQEEVLRQERLKTSLEIASSIQRGLFPRTMTIPGYDIAWVTRSCDETGGDYFDFIKAGRDEGILAVGDVSGHGLGAALLMAMSRANLRTLLSVKKDLREVMERLNNLLASDMEADKFMTLCLICLDYRRHCVDYVNAGHDRPLIYCSNESRVLELKSAGLPLGMLTGVSYSLEGRRILLPGDALLLTTDGIWEASNMAGEAFGRQRLRKMLMDTAGTGAQGIVDAILKEVEHHGRGLPERDDMTLAVLKRLG